MVCMQNPSNPMTLQMRFRDREVLTNSNSSCLPPQEARRISKCSRCECWCEGALVECLLSILKESRVGGEVPGDGALGSDLRQLAGR